MDEAANSESRQTGSLDGMILFRFAHMVRERSAGGVEAHLWDLNRTLLERSRMRIMQMYLVLEGEPADVRVERVGRGELIWIPSTLKGVSAEKLKYVERLRAKFRRMSTLTVNHERVIASLDEFLPNLAVFHWISEDSKAILDCMKSRGVPIAVVNHFENPRLRYRLTRTQIADAVAIGGVSPVDVPKFLSGKFIHLSDGIDVDFFSPRKALPCPSSVAERVIFFPSRICKEKGHLDAVRALGILRRSGVKAVLALAGRQGTRDFTESLYETILTEGLRDHVRFVGELSPDDLREWFARADVVVLPSYSEGLPRVLLEGQAMGKPVLAYDVGGVRAAVREGVSGLLFKKGDIEGLAKSLRQLLGDDTLRGTMGEKGREFVAKHFSLTSVALRHEAFYLSALRQENSGSP